MSLIKADKNLFFSKNDANDRRLGDFATEASVQDIDNKNDGVFLIGYPDDEGIRANVGRPGAESAPDIIRRYLYKTTPSLYTQKETPIFDLGNLDIKSGNLAQRHDFAKSIINKLNSKQKKWLSLGGGHDYGYPDAAGFASQFAESIVINFDAHLDVRPDNTPAGITSGSSFHRLLNEFKQSELHFYEFGIQPHCNSRQHLQWAQDHGAKVFLKNSETLANQFTRALSHLCTKNLPVFLSVDIDGFSSDCAPGCSQSWTSGYHYSEFTEAYFWLLENFDVRGVGIYEVSPPLDQDNRTSKLATLIAHEFISRF